VAALAGDDSLGRDFVCPGSEVVPLDVNATKTQRLDL